MIAPPWTHLDRYRLAIGRMRSPFGADYGCFAIPTAAGQTLTVIASNAHDEQPDWEHVSVSLKNRCPNWAEMSLIKSLFWTDDETVVQYHPPRAEYVNQHPYVLHLWRHARIEFPRPPTWMVGTRDGQTDADAVREGITAMGTPP